MKPHADPLFFRSLAREPAVASVDVPCERDHAAGSHRQSRQASARQRRRQRRAAACVGVTLPRCRRCAERGAPRGGRGSSRPRVFSRVESARPCVDGRRAAMPTRWWLTSAAPRSRSGAATSRPRRKCACSASACSGLPPSHKTRAPTDAGRDAGMDARGRATQGAVAEQLPVRAQWWP